MSPSVGTTRIGLAVTLRSNAQGSNAKEPSSSETRTDGKSWTSQSGGRKERRAEAFGTLPLLKQSAWKDTKYTASEHRILITQWVGEAWEVLSNDLKESINSESEDTSSASDDEYEPGPILEMKV
ncbi:hypothetical protein BGX38DRAFT_1277407 [Terfezia claveryi]|nr:hypothetical protein BGX38DRAFT_1277407 [Terfezia claveryi]